MEPKLQDIELREQDRWLPIANVARLMKNTLPNTAKVSKDAKECMQECVSEFISFVTSEASDKCLREKRKTINGEDILYSMHDLGFENYAEVLKIYLAKYREQQALRQERGETRATKRQLKQQAAAAAAAAAATANGEDGTAEQAVAVAIGHENEASSSTGSVSASAEYDEAIKEEEDEDVPYLNGSIDENEHHESLSHSPIGSIHSEHLYNDYEKQQIKEEERIDEEQEEHPHTKEYGYDDFINTDEVNHHHHNIEELAKQLTHENGDIDSLGITNGSNEYF
ncbi:uncharacterized protein SPAPADRAFT_59668 [Spathaspora passalidarum NRRL Y-27907]|uniref:Transcription factor CBF/NF-Y/archaeal histone domain-containing protein n=1 Tax=Spathaspora passalidarum (strain NRRL Y-27907 / 11-Y1) TaxID=619300 RepID=G3AHS6_SPAPN|nr:uncharacterized protein SPAPADRAFT_59668 [Spathaspora passalidarum NRRL Y-27907]EGW34240.1 hypothetical protein SPAPADRAFT_59668 [Spathaspora passalidarum NRRL Y-27907]